MKSEFLGGGHEEVQRGEVGAEVAAIYRGEAVGLHTGVGGDQEIGNEVLAGSAFSPIAEKNLAGEVGGRGFDRFIKNVEAIQVEAGGFERGVVEPMGSATVFQPSVNSGFFRR